MTALAEATQLARWSAVNAGETLFNFGDVTSDVFIIARGGVRVMARTPCGQEFILNDLGPGDIFGEMAAIDRAPRSACVTALTSTLLCRLPGTAFLSVAVHSPRVCLRLLRILTVRLRLQAVRIAEMALLPARLRVAAELLRLARPVEASLARVISPPPPQHILAARVGVRREHVSRILNDLVRQGLVEISPRRILLLHPERLRLETVEPLQAASDGAPHHQMPGVADMNRTRGGMA
ncbi:MAG: Crp/Fnr family transcriptional regulator [Proteobacteria bacterium]|nr:Crp/Fnr family transcriptional regulator [Pseudomonadota bacterium]